MLFPLQSNQQALRIVGERVTTSPFSVDINPDDIIGGSSGGGLFSAPLRAASSRPVQCFGRPNASGPAFFGGLVFYTHANTTTTNVAGTICGSNGTNGGIAVNATSDQIYVASDSRITDRVMRNMVSAQKRQQGAIMVGRVSSAGAVTDGIGDFSCVRNSAGNYTITFKRRIYGQIPLVLIAPFTTGAFYGVSVNTVTTTGFNVTLGTIDTRAPTDVGFNILVYGFSAKDTYGRAFANVMCTRRKGRINTFRIESGALTVGAQNGTLTVNGAGDFTIALRDPYRSKCYAFVSCGNSTARAGQLNSAVDSGASLRTAACDPSAATAANSTFLDVLTIGFDDPSDY